MMFLYVIRDLVAQESGPIFEAKNDGVASRQMGLILSKSKTPQDFVLFCVGSYSHENDEGCIHGARTVPVSLDTEIPEGGF